MRTRIGTLFQVGQSVTNLPGFASRAECLGFDELWVVHDCFHYGGLAAAATALAATSQLSVGIGLIPSLVTNPTILAMELGSLAELYPSRIQVAFGHGVREWMQKIGIKPRSRLTALEEVIFTVRGLLEGKMLNHQGPNVTLDDVQLAWPPQSPPKLLIGATGPRGIELAAKAADGLVLPEGAGPLAIAAARRTLGRGKLVTYAWLRLDDDRDAARRIMRDVIEPWREWGLYPRLMEYGGLSPERPTELRDVDDISIVGGPLECARSVLKMAAAGASTIVLMPTGDDHPGQLQRFAAEALPLVLAESST